MSSEQFQGPRGSGGRRRLLRLGSELGWILLGNAAVATGSIVGIRVLTELLDPRTYGQVSLGMTLAIFVNLIIMVPVSNGSLRFYAPAVEAGQLRSFLKTVRLLSWQAVALVCVLILIASPALYLSGHAAMATVVCAALVFGALNGLNGILNGIQIAARQRSIVAFHQGLEAWARFFIAAALVLVLGATSTVALAGFALAALLVVGSQYLFFRRSLRASVTSDDSGDGDWYRTIWTYSWPFASWGIFGWAQQSADRWALGLFSSTKEVGLYSALFQIGYYPVTLLSGLAVQFIAPICYARAGDATDAARNASVSRLCWGVAGAALLVTMLAMLVTLFFHSGIFALLVAKEYAEISPLLTLMVAGGGLFAAGQVVALIFMSQMKSRQLMMAKIVTSVIGIALSFAMAYEWGARGVVIGGLVTAALYLAWMVALQIITSRRAFSRARS